MARPKVHKVPRRSTGLRLDEDVIEALRAHNNATGIPMNRTIQDGTKEKLIKEGFYKPQEDDEPVAEVESLPRKRAILQKGA